MKTNWTFKMEIMKYTFLWNQNIYGTWLSYF